MNELELRAAIEQIKQELCEPMGDLERGNLARSIAEALDQEVRQWCADPQPVDPEEFIARIVIREAITKPLIEKIVKRLGGEPDFEALA